MVATDEPSPVDYTEGRELGVQIERAIALLRPEYATAVTLFHMEGLAYEEIAETMSLPLGTVKTFIHRARKELRQHLAHLETEA